MEIVVADEALTWFKDEMEVEPGDAIRFFTRYGGSSPLHEGFSLGITKEEPDELAVQVEYDLHVNVDANLNELTYPYKKS